MNKFTYNRGAWTDGHELPEYLADEDEASYFGRLRLNPNLFQMGADEGPHFLVHAFKSGGAHLATVNLGDDEYEVYLPDFPSAMMFIRDFGSAFAVSPLEINLEHLIEKLERVAADLARSRP